MSQRLLPYFRPWNVQTPTTLQTNQTYLDEISCPGSLGVYLDPVICSGVQKDLGLTTVVSTVNYGEQLTSSEALISVLER